MEKDKADLLQGTLDILILKALQLEPMHGFGLAQRLKQMSAEVFSEAASAILTHARTVRKLGPLVAVTAVFLVGVPLRADLRRLLGHGEVDVFTDTTVTEAGRARPAPTPAAPVYYKIIDRGETNFHSTWAGGQLPSKHTARQWLKSVLAKQGYLLADFQHPPTLLLVFAWGMTRENAFNFLGGNKMPPPPPVVGPTGIWYVLLSVTADPGTFVGLLLAYTIESESAAKPTLLWMTRFGSPSIGFSFRESMPVMIEASAPHFGRETDKPVHLAVLRSPSGKVTFGDIKVLGEVNSLPPPADKPAANEPK